MRVHSIPQRRVPSTLSLDNTIDSPPMMDTSVPAVFPPAVRRFAPDEEYKRHSDAYSASVFGRESMVGGIHVPTVSERLSGYDRRNTYDDSGIEVQLTNGDLALIGNRLCREDSGLSINDARGEASDGGCGGRFERIKKMCSFRTLSSVGSEQSIGTSRTQYWMLIITPVVSSFSLALVIAAVVGPQWLLTEEKIPLAAYHNNTHHTATVPSTSASFHNQQLNILHPHLIPAIKDDGGGFLTKYTRSSLWMLCSKYTGGPAPAQQNQNQNQQQPVGGADFQCASIDYFPSEGYSPDPNDSSNAIPYTVTHSSPFFLASNGVLIVSYGLFLVAMCSTKHKICYFVSGVLFIISGLLMLIGLIMYISILKAEIGSKLRPRSSLQAPQFTFRYGQSFLLYVFGFIITELSGILNVLIYSNVQQEEYEEQLHRHRHHGSSHQDYPTYQNLSEGFHYNMHYQRECDQLHKAQTGQETLGPPIVDYRYPYDGLEGGIRSPRYYFERQQREVTDDPTCRVHARKLGHHTGGVTKSLTDLLYTEPEPSEVSPGERRSGDGQPRVNEVSAPRELPSMLPGGRLVPDGGEGRPKVGNICGISRQYLTRELSKEKLFNEFCKKVGPRPKPKNIYYIESNEGHHGDDSYRSVFVVDPSISGSSTRGRSHRRRNSTSESWRRRTHDPLPCISGYRQRIHSDNSLDVVADDEGAEYGRRRDPIGRARSVDYRQTLPRNFQQRRQPSTSEPEDETGGFAERQALERKRVSASGLLMEPVRLNASHGDLTVDGLNSGWHRGTGRQLQHHLRATKTSTIHCPKYLDPPTYSPTLGGSVHRHHGHPLLQPQLHPTGRSPSISQLQHHSIGDLTSQQLQHHLPRRPTILSSQVFSPIMAQPPQQQRHGGTAHQEPVVPTNRHPSLPSPVFDLDRIEQERRKSHSQLFLSGSAAGNNSSTTVGQYDFVNGTAV
ncbi:AGAP012963-PA-like protein [Anopheles sinensis]|uniref:AGAP012963-PA-like protein n=1 Tax=Anopheles sinensis TaxID=74873 RepID=A0A084WT33_ANOSI|nr:AGAP012963-PA-like protein [Anopheles sinensis]